VNAKGTMSLKEIDRFLRWNFTTPSNWIVEMSKTRQEIGESVSNFVARLKLAIFKGRYESFRSHEMDESDFIEFFSMNALPELRERLHMSMPSTSESVIKIALQSELENSIKKQAIKVKSECQEWTSEHEISRGEKSHDNKPKQIHVDYYSNNEHNISFALDKTEPVIKSPNKKNRIKGNCWFCQRPGHRYATCRKATTTDIKQLNLMYCS
jgi:hypothetical protein